MKQLIKEYIYFKETNKLSVMVFNFIYNDVLKFINIDQEMFMIFLNRYLLTNRNQFFERYDAMLNIKSLHTKDGVFIKYLTD